MRVSGLLLVELIGSNARRYDMKTGVVSQYILQRPIR